MPFCPQCGTEYRPGFTTCADCEVALTDSPPEPSAVEQPEEQEADWVSIYTGTGRPVDLIESMLQGNGLPVVRLPGESAEVFPIALAHGAEHLVLHTLAVPAEVYERHRAMIDGAINAAGVAVGEEDEAARAEAEQDFDVRGCPECGLYFHDFFTACPGCGTELVPAVELFTDAQAEPDRVIVAAGLDLPMKDLGERLKAAGFDAEAFSVEEWLVAAVDVPWRELTERTTELEALVPRPAAETGGPAI
jgi:predicted amidophosphoribosyltransferase